MLKYLITAPIVATVIGFSAVGFACQYEENEPFITDPALPAIAVDDFEVTVDSITRAPSEQPDDCTYGWVVLDIEPVDPEVGYTIAVTEGPAPENLRLFPQPTRPLYGGFSLFLGDKFTENQPPLNFTLRVTAIGPNGDAGPFRDVVVSDPGTEEGCSATGHHDASLLALMAFGTFLFWRRREA